MVKGLDLFLAHFQPYGDRYVLIGGTACDLAMAGAGIGFRATKDRHRPGRQGPRRRVRRRLLDVCSRGRVPSAGESTGEKQFYRFHKPTDDAYPFMMELFSRQPEALQGGEGSHLTPLLAGDDVSSLSAILMDEERRRRKFHLAIIYDNYAKRLGSAKRFLSARFCARSYCRRLRKASLSPEGRPCKGRV